MNEILVHIYVGVQSDTITQSILGSRNGVMHAIDISLVARNANNKGADQSAHSHNLISALLIRHLESTIS